MRKITKDASNAFWGGREFYRGNTSVEVTEFWTYLILHGNRIARLSPNLELWINNCGFSTRVTVERVRGMLRDGCVYVKNSVWHYENGHGVREIPDGEWFLVK